MEMNQVWNYMGYEFNVRVQFDTMAEKCIGGKRFHTIILNHLSAANYQEQDNEAEDSNLCKRLKQIKGKAMSWVDKRGNTQPLSPVQLELLEEGFEII